MAEENSQKSSLERFLGLFSEVHASEGSTVLLLAINSFLILSAYYVLKPIREALILTGGGAEVKSYSSAGQALLLLLIVPAYGFLASKVPRRLLINSVTLFFIACLVVFYILGRAQVPLGIVFYLWVGIFNVMVPAQFWAFANDVYSVQAGQRLFPIIAFGSSAGAVFGSFMTKYLIDPIGILQLMLVGGAILGVSLVLTNIVERKERPTVKRTEATKQPEPELEAPLGKDGAFRLLFKNRYLLYIALLMLFLNLVNSTGEYLLGRTVKAAATAAGGDVEDFIGKFYSDFFGIVNLVSMIAQLFLVSRIIKYLKIRGAILIHPLIALGSYSLLALYPVLSIVRIAKIADNSTDYSLQNTVRQSLFLPTTREEKYKAKQAIDTFFMRSGDVLSACLVYAGTNWLFFSTRQFSWVNVCFVGVWFFLAILIGRGYQQRTANQTPQAAPAKA